MKNMKFWDNLKKNQEPSTYTAKKSHIPFRLNFLFFIIFGLFVSLIVRLGYLQIVEGESFEERIAQGSKLTVETASPRGEIYDATGKLLVTNQSNLAITYTRGKSVQAEELLEIANRVNELINVPADELTERDRKDFWLANKENLKTAQERLTDKEKKDEKGNTIVDQSTLYSLTVDKVTPEEINFDEHTLQAATIFKRMNAVSALNTTFIKNQNVTDQEIAVIGEHVAEIPGISTGVDWTREYPEDTLRSILGTVSTEKTGLPAEEADEYLAKGYARNDRVGTSYLEKQYEPVLQGTKSKSELSLDSDGKVTSQTAISEGEKGQNLKLTIDTEFQKKVEEAVRAQYQTLIASGAAKYSNGAYVAVTNPKTGAVLALVGLDHDLKTNELVSNPLATITNAFPPGSVVKGATLSAGYEQGIIHGNEVMLDEPIQIAGSGIKASNFNPRGKINITAEQALEYSSNTYMMKLVFGMLGTEYSYNMLVPYSSGDSRVFDILRGTFGEYGMGVSTGLDLPGESTGIVPKNFDDENVEARPNAGNLLDLSFGQFDTYTALQLAQYVGTVANDGKRVAAHLVQGIYGSNMDGTLGDLTQDIQPTVLNEVNISAEQMQLIQNGFHQVVYGTSGYTTGKYMRDAKLEMAAKTGTAETTTQDENGTFHETVNSNVIAYAPYDDPKIAISVILPNLDLKSDSYITNQLIAKDIVNIYSDMYKQ